MNRDSFYTPTSLAKKLISFIETEQIASIADFCVGNGDLLRAALSRWPSARCFGTDISDKVVQSLKTNECRWNIGKCNFLETRSRNSCSIFRRIKGGVDLILMNPPFSCLGGTRHKVILNGKIFYASTSMVFIVEALKFLSSIGELNAIVPNSVAYSEKDKALWSELHSCYCVTILEEFDQRQFSNCAPHVLLLSIKQNEAPKPVRRFVTINSCISSLSVFRGKVSMYKLPTLKKGKYFLIHSTNLKGHSISSLIHKVSNKASKICGPAVLIPRVGTPDIQKICIIKENQSFILSDCVLAITTNNYQDALILQTSLINQWNDFKLLYKGTGAKYITMKKLNKFLKLE